MDDSRRCIYDRYLKEPYSPRTKGAKRIEAGSIAAKSAVQDHDLMVTLERSQEDEKEARLSRIKYMRITAEADAARKRAIREEECMLVKLRQRAEIEAETANAKTRAAELLAFQTAMYKRKRETAEEEALIKARDLEDQRRKAEQRSKLGKSRR